MNFENEIRNAEQLPLFLTVSHVSQISGLCKNICYKLAHSKGFPSIIFGRRILIPRDAFIRWMEEQAIIHR